MECVWRAVIWSTLIPALTVSGALAGLRMAGWHLRAVQSNSMTPTFQAGDMIVVKPRPAAALHPGMVVSYHWPEQPHPIVTHRLLRIDAGGRLVTTGDRLRTVDPPVSAGQIEGQAIAVVPGAGSLIAFLRKPAVLAATVYVPAVWLLGSELQRLARSWRPTYRLGQRLEV